MKQKLKFAVIGAGFWSNYQIHAWQELDKVELVAICDTDLEKAKLAAEQHGISNYYKHAGDLFENENLDFVDIISSISSHAPLVLQSAEYGVPVICQKPMADDWDTCRKMVMTCREAGVKFFIHENFRFQAPIRRCKKLLDEGLIGESFKARLTFCSGFPVFENQPALAELDRFIIMDLGVHLLDVARYLFGEAEQIYCQTQQINPSIKGEDVANILLTMENGFNCFIEASYASHLEVETFPQLLLLIEGTEGSIKLDKDYKITITRKDKGSDVIFAEPPFYHWANPDYENVHSSIVECNKNILSDLLLNEEAETAGKDNLKTMELVFLCYESSIQLKVLTPSL